MAKKPAKPEATEKKSTSSLPSIALYIGEDAFLRQELTAAGGSMLDRKDGYTLEPVKP